MNNINFLYPPLSIFLSLYPPFSLSISLSFSVEFIA